MSPKVERVRSAAIVAALLCLAACGGDDAAREPVPTLANGETGAATPEPRVAGPPDAGTRAGHGADLAAQFEQPARGIVRVPARDTTPPLAMLRLDAGGTPVVHASPVQPQPRPALRLTRPRFSATALIRDGDGGTGRIRVSVVYTTRCDGVDQQHGDYFPPAQIESIKIAPGARVPVQRERTADVRLPDGCDVNGKVFAEATNAAGLEAFSDPIWFRYEPA